MKYKAIFFDLDGVLTTNHSGGQQMCNVLSEALGVDVETVSNAYKPFGKQLGSGQITYADVLPALCEATGKEVTMAHIQAAFESTPKNAAMFELAESLKDQGFTIGVITDNDKERFAALKQHLGIEELFEPLILSADVGSFKDTTIIFEKALSAAGVEASQSIFIDNKESNLDAAKELGITTIWFDDAKNNVEELKKTIENLIK